jgi:hypothetical protein
MAESHPIACSLDAEGYATRLAAVRDLGEVALVRTQRHGIDAGVDLFFREGEEIHRRLRNLVAAESKCCAFLDMKLHAADGTLRLSISGPAHAAPVVDDLVQSFESG